MCKGSILVVEDEAIVAEDLSRKLSRLGYDVVGVTASGEESVARARERRPDLVLMDIRLEGPMDGVEAAQAIRRECDVPVIYLTAHSDSGTLERAKVTEPFGYILKPFEAPQLETQIQMALYKHQAEREAHRQREWLRVTLQSIGDAVITTDAAGKVTSLNPVAEELTGWKMAEALNRPLAEVFNIINEKTRQPAFNPVGRVLEAGKVVGLANHTALISREGRETAIEDSAAPIKDAQGRIVGVVMVFHDVTEKRQAEERLRESEEKYRAYFHTAAVGTVQMGLDGRFVEVNERFCRMTGYSREELLGMGQAELSHPEDAKRDAERLGAYLRGETSTFKSEKRHIRKDGRVIWVVITAALVRDAEGRPLRSAGVIQDITERKAAEEARALLAAIVESSEDAIITKDLAGRITSWNGGAERLFGYRADEAIGLPITCIIPAELQAEEATILERLRHGELISHFETVRLAREGRRLAVSLTVSPLRDASGAITGASKIIRDITEQKRAQEAVRRGEARLAQAVRVAGLGTFEHDHPTDIIEYSPVMRELVGFEADEKVTIAAKVEKVAPEDREALAAAIRRAHDPGGNGLFEVEYRVANRQGKVRWVSARSQTFFEGEGSERRPVRTIGAALDVTQRKELQAELQRLVDERTAKLKELVGELEHFSYSITHDMRAPLRGMQGFAEMMAETCAACTEQNAVDFLRRIRTSAARMDLLITDALNYSRTVRQELELEAVDVGALLRGMLDSYPELQSSKADIELKGEIPLVMGNEAALTQCFSNLLGNAVKFVKRGQRPDIKIWGEVRGDAEMWVRIWVEDKGIGVPKLMLPRVFEMFSRGHSSEAYEGTGIGLALVRKVVQRMGGRVGVESEEGQGSRFWVELRPGK